MDQVPTLFQSAPQYMDVFRNLLLEEVFAALASGLAKAADSYRDTGAAT
ncbi:unnamed protein product, partial [Discosporangium mesarthrocarpum]